MMAFLVWLFRILIILLIVRLVVHWFAARRIRSARASAGTLERAGGALVRDPQCGTYIPQARAIKDGGEYFCSAGCRDAWLAAAGRAASR